MKVCYVLLTILNLSCFSICHAQYKLYVLSDINSNDIGSGFTGHSYAGGFKVLGSNLYFFAVSGPCVPEYCGNIYKTDGKNVTVATPPGYDLTFYNDKIYFIGYNPNQSGGTDIWTIDSNGKASVLISDYPNSLEPSQLIVCNGLLFYYTHFKNLSVWNATNGINTQIRKFKSIYNPIAFRNKLYFVADDSLNGRELWVSDGTSTGTSMIKDIYPGTESSNPKDLFIFKNRLYFTADDGVTGRELWVSDGETSGTTLFKNISASSSSDASNFYISDKFFLFSALDDAHGNEPWCSDGTESGTYLISDINPGVQGSYPKGFIFFKNRFYYSAKDSTYGRELWVSNIFDSTSNPAFNFDNDIYDSHPESLIVFEDKLFMKAVTSLGYQVWIADESGSSGELSAYPLLPQVYPYYNTVGDQQSGYYTGDGFTVFNDALFFTADINHKGREPVFITKNAVGLKTPELNFEFSIYPNPSQNIVNIQIFTPGMIRISDSNGRIVYEVYADENFSIDSTSFGSGIYIVSHSNGSKIKWVNLN